MVWAVNHLVVCADCTDVGMEHRRGGGGDSHILPLLLVLGFSSGYSVWMVPVGPIWSGPTKLRSQANTPIACWPGNEARPYQAAHLCPAPSLEETPRSSTRHTEKERLPGPFDC